MGQPFRLGGHVAQRPLACCCTCLPLRRPAAHALHPTAPCLLPTCLRTDHVPQTMKERGWMRYTAVEEGDITVERSAVVPEDIDRSRVRFQQASRPLAKRMHHAPP